jgi:putative molybdopterin biosynthesis protein
MSVYLHDIPLYEAQACFQQALADAGLSGILGVEEIPLNENAVGRVLAEPVWARFSSPHYHASAMDGFAVRAAQIAGAMPTAPISLAVGEQAAYVDTGDPLPEWANTVVPIENVEALDALDQPADDPRHPDRIRVRAGQTPWSHVRPLGEDIVATQLVLPSGQVLRPVDLGALAAGGAVQIRVSRRPRVAVLPTGTELIPIGQSPQRGDIIEYNSIVLAAQIQSWGGEAVRYPISADNLEVICQRVQQAADTCDLVLVNAGSSAGSEDFSAKVVEDLGRLLVHGVAVRPGHPVILGMVCRTAKLGDPEQMVPIIGVPGYPVSAALTGEIFVEPLLAAWTGRSPARPVEVSAALTRKVTSPPGDDDYLRVVAGRVGEKLLAAPLSRGAGVITSLVKADGIVILPRGVQGLEAGAPVQVRLYRAPHELEETIFAIGSHDMTLDLLAQYLSEKGRRLVSANVGSQGGLVALRRGEAHLAGSHLLDPETGEYNLSSIRQYLPEIPVRLVTWVHREQGLLVARGNPKGIRGLPDLVRPDITFVNRQRGAGTRVLLDFELKKLGISVTEVSGYDQEEYTHLAVAAAVASGRADCGLAVTASARALDLDFIPLFHERYDLVIPIQHLAGGLLAPLFALMQDSRFRQAVAALPGYDIREMGSIVRDHKDE